MRRLVLVLLLAVPPLAMMCGWTAPTYYPLVTTPWYDASAGGETAPITEGVADGVTYIYSTTLNGGSKSFLVNVPEDGTYMMSASVSAPISGQNSWYVNVTGVRDLNNAATNDSFVVNGVGQGFHEEPVNGVSFTQKGTRYWGLTAGTKTVVWVGRNINTALACFRLVRVQYFPRPSEDAERWFLDE